MHRGRDRIETALISGLVVVALLQAALLVVGMKGFATLF